MTRSIKACLKLDVYALKEGLRLGRPHDILVDPKKHRVAALIMAIQIAPQTASAIEGRAVKSFSEDTLPVSDVSVVRLGYQEPELLEIIEQNLHFRNRDILSTEGHSLGRIVDVILDDNGGVVEYLVAKGLVRRLLRLHRSVKPSEMRTAGEDVAVVKEEPKSQD